MIVFSVLITLYLVSKKYAFWIAAVFFLLQNLLTFRGKLLPPVREVYPRTEQQFAPKFRNTANIHSPQPTLAQIWYFANLNF
jgi:hypothetical protein